VACSKKSKGGGNSTVIAWETVAFFVRRSSIVLGSCAVAIYRGGMWHQCGIALQYVDKTVAIRWDRVWQ
jgi:hypothetical protein